METPWATIEEEERISIVHDNRWLAIFGVPLAVMGLVVGIGPWFLDEVRHSGAWPILAGGSLIGAGIVVAGLALCFKYDEMVADRKAEIFIRRTGLPPFQRTKKWPLGDFSGVACVEHRMGSSSGGGSSLHHCVQLTGAGAPVLLAMSRETEPIRAEAQRWADFLGLTFSDRMGADLRDSLRDAGARRSSSKS